VLEELQSHEPAMRFEAAQAAGEMGLKAAVQHLIQCIDDTDASVRQAAVSALGKIGGPAAKRALQALLQFDDEVLVQAAEDALDELNFGSGAEADSLPGPARSAPGSDGVSEDLEDLDEFDDDLESSLEEDDFDDDFEAGFEMDDDGNLDWDGEDEDDYESIRGEEHEF